MPQSLTRHPYGSALPYSLSSSGLLQSHQQPLQSHCAPSTSLGPRKFVFQIFACPVMCEMGCGCHAQLLPQIHTSHSTNHTTNPTAPHHKLFHAVIPPSLPAVPPLPAASTLRTYSTVPYLPSVPVYVRKKKTALHIKTRTQHPPFLKVLYHNCVSRRTVLVPTTYCTGASSPEKATVPKKNKK